MKVSRRLLCLITFFGLILATSGLVLAGAKSDAGSKSPEMGRIRVAADGKRFEMADSGRAFVPWGFNYLGKFDHLAEDDWDTDEGWKRIEVDFQEMKKLGANVVRWHLQFETFMDSPNRPDAVQLARLKKLLDLSRASGLYLDLTGLNCFRKDRVPKWFDALNETDRWQAQARFWEAVAATCAGDPVVFCFDLMNEPVINEPGPNDHPWLGGELGGFWFVQRISHTPHGRDTKEIAEVWVKTLVAAIRKQNRSTPITVGVIPFAFTWATAEPVFYSPQVARHLDFVSIHVYPATGKRVSELAALAKYDIGKPLVIEETFPMGCSLADFDAFVDAASGRADGWIAHYFGATPEQHRAGARPNAAVVPEFLEYWPKKGAKLAPPAHD